MEPVLPRPYQDHPHHRTIPPQKRVSTKHSHIPGTNAISRTSLEDSLGEIKQEITAKYSIKALHSANKAPHAENIMTERSRMNASPQDEDPFGCLLHHSIFPPMDCAAAQSIYEHRCSDSARARV